MSSGYLRLATTVGFRDDFSDVFVKNHSNATLIHKHFSRGVSGTDVFRDKFHFSLFHVVGNQFINFGYFGYFQLKFNSNLDVDF